MLSHSLIFSLPPYYTSYEYIDKYYYYIASNLYSHSEYSEYYSYTYLSSTSISSNIYVRTGQTSPYYYTRSYYGESTSYSSGNTYWYGYIQSWIYTIPATISNYENVYAQGYAIARYKSSNYWTWGSKDYIIRNRYITWIEYATQYSYTGYYNEQNQGSHYYKYSYRRGSGDDRYYAYGYKLDYYYYYYNNKEYKAGYVCRYTEAFYYWWQSQPYYRYIYNAPWYLYEYYLHTPAQYYYNCIVVTPEQYIYTPAIQYTSVYYYYNNL